MVAKNEKRKRGRPPKNKKSKEKNEKEHLFQLKPEVKNSIISVIMFALGVVILLGFMGQGGQLGEVFSGISRRIMGQGMFLLPLGFFLAGFAVLKSAKERPSRIAFLGIFLFLLSILSLFDILAGAGGTFGRWLGYPFIKFTGFWVSLVIFLTLLFISIILAFDLSLSRKEKEAGESEEEDKEQKEDLPATVSENAKVSLAGKIKGAFGRKEEKEITSIPVSDKREEDAIQVPVSPLLGAISRNYKFPPLSLLDEGSAAPLVGDIEVNANVIKRTLQNFGINVEMDDVNIGPSVTQYTLKPATGVKLSKITTLQSDLALSLAAHPLRIEAPIPGRSLVGIEVPNKRPALVRLKELLENDKDRNSLLRSPLGRDVSGVGFYSDLARMPHLLVAGATGSGKSVCIHSIITSLLYRNTPETLRFIFVDPKRVELTLYNGIPHLLTPVITDPHKTLRTLKWAVGEMERRYEMLSEESVKDITGFNAKVSKRKNASLLPYLVIVIDELADLMTINGREVEGAIVRLAQMARAVGIHLIVSTQRPSIEVITGLIKANITTRIAFQVASQVDSRTILDMAGAEKLLGKGDMLYLAGDIAKPKRIQGSFVSEKEVKKISKYWGKYAVKSEEVEGGEETVFSSTKGNGPAGFEPLATEASSLQEAIDQEAPNDDLYEEAVEVIRQSKRASASLLQRRLRVGYARAARILDILEEKGIIGPSRGAKPREVLINQEEEEVMDD